jgi:hypothetical protein
MEKMRKYAKFWLGLVKGTNSLEDFGVRGENSKIIKIDLREIVGRERTGFV